VCAMAILPLFRFHMFGFFHPNKPRLSQRPILELWFDEDANIGLLAQHLELLCCYHFVFDITS
jgi:hypothetical protein